MHLSLSPSPSFCLDIVYSQPADTGTGQNVNTQLVYLVNHLKSNGNPMRLQDLAILTNTPVDTDKVLLEKFRAHDRVVHDPKTDLYSYRVRADILLHESLRNTQAAPLRCSMISMCEIRLLS